MKSIVEYITEKKGGYMWLTTGSGRIEIYVTKSDFDKGVAVYMVKDQLKKFTDEDILNELNDMCADKYDMSEFKDRKDLIATFLDVYDDFWEEGDAPLK